VLALPTLTVAVKSVCVPGATVTADGVIETEVTVVAPLPQPDIRTTATKIISRPVTDKAFDKDFLLSANTRATTHSFDIVS
jgi:hypothetical protein